MSNLDVLSAALRWEGARARRLVIGAQQRKVDERMKVVPLFSTMACNGLALQSRLRDQFEEARRQETSALRLLAKVCGQHRAAMGGPDDAIQDVELIELLN